MKRWLDNDYVLGGLNSLTKFPSIPTYHVMGEKGRLTETIEPSLASSGADFVATEKVDGTNCRVLCFPDGSFLVGSREELLWYSEDLLGDRAHHIAETVRNVRDAFEDYVLRSGSHGLTVVYLEVYGHGVGANGKQYSKELRHLRVFDVAYWEALTWWKLAVDPDLGKEELARRRDAGHQPFLSWDSVKAVAEQLALPHVQERPLSLSGGPRQLLEFLLNQPRSEATLDATAPGVCEGLVMRSRGGNACPPFHQPVLRAKLRLEDYRRTLRGSAVNDTG